MKKLFTYLMTLEIMSISGITIVSCACSYPKQNKLEEEKQRKDSDRAPLLPINNNDPKKEESNDNNPKKIGNKITISNWY